MGDFAGELNRFLAVLPTLYALLLALLPALVHRAH